MYSKKLLIIALIFVVCVLSLSITFSKIIRQTTANNIITFGDIKMKSYLTTIENDIEKKVYDGDNFDITNNSDVNRIIQIQNIGNHPIFVRVSFDFVENTKGTNIESLVTFYQKDIDWIYKDGWYYYKKQVNPNIKTEKLIVSFSFNVNEITKIYPKSLLKLDIKIEAVQSENNSKNVLEAIGWPTK